MKANFEKLIASKDPVLIDFYADWCAPCKMMKPILHQIKEQMGDQIKIIQIDTDKNQDVSMKMGIRSIPTLILFKGGKLLWRQSGVLPAEQLLSKIQQAV